MAKKTYYKAGDPDGCTGNGTAHRDTIGEAAVDAQRVPDGVVWEVTVTTTEEAGR